MHGSHLKSLIKCYSFKCNIHGFDAACDFIQQNIHEQKKKTLIFFFFCQPDLNYSTSLGWKLPRFSCRRVNLLLWVFIIMTEIKDQAIIVQNLLGSYEKIPTGDKFKTFSVSLVSKNWSLCPNRNILSVISVAPVSSQKYSQYKQVLDALVQGSAVVSGDEKACQAFSIQMNLFHCVVNNTHRVKMKWGH